MGTQVPSRGVPGNVRDTVVLTRAQELHICAKLGFLLVRVVVGSEIQVPEFNVGLGGRGEDTKHNVSTLGRPHDSVRNLTVEMFDRDEIALLRVWRVEVNVELDHHTGDVLAIVGVVGRDERESVSIWFPGELRDVIWGQRRLG